MRMRVLYVAYPLLPVSEKSAGGAEQMLCVLEREIARRGHETVVAACAGSKIGGKLLATGSVTAVDEFEAREAEHTRRVLSFVADCERQERGIDLIHDESGHFWRHAARINVPVLATLHLPRHFYSGELFATRPPNLFFNCVSETQRKTFDGLDGLLHTVQNGIDVERFARFKSLREKTLLWVGRICEEKGTHIAIEVAERARMPLIIAGQVYPFSYHQAYFEREVVPRIERASVPARFIDSPNFEQKAKLMRQAHALIIPALVDETSSLVALEAMACGTPVVAFRRGALDEVVKDGETGFVVDTLEEMAAALGRVESIKSEVCRKRAEEHFSARRMADEYEELYEVVVQKSSMAGAR